MTVTVVIEHGRGSTSFPVSNKDEWDRVVALMREKLAGDASAGRCSAVTVAVHLQDERCDHEHAP